MLQMELLDNSVIIIVVMIFCVVQSVFGMGLLVFGTPTLIILNVPFLDCLFFLVPASLTISLLQIGSISNFRQSELAHSIPLLISAVFLGFLIHILPIGPVRLEGVLGIILFCHALSRMSAGIWEQATQFVRNHFLAMTAAMGILHGASNMGGAILAILASSRFSDKDELRGFIAANYAVLASSQLIALLLVFDRWPVIDMMVSATIALAVYTLLGRRVFGSIGSQEFRGLFTGFIFLYSFALLWKYLQYSSTV